MAIITPALIQAHFKQFSKLFQGAFDGAEPEWDKIAFKTTSSSKENTYGWLGQFPGFREWVGDRVHKDMAAHGYSITNKHFEDSVSINRNEIEDDNIGVYGALMAELGRAGAMFPDQLVFNLLKNAENELCYDGQPFFDTDHPVFENADGTGTVEMVSNHQGGTGKPWYLMEAHRVLKPLIYQERKKMQFVTMNKDDDESVYVRNEYRYGADVRCNVGFGLWQMAYMSRQELTGDTFNAAMASMQETKTDGGRPLGITPSMLVVPPSLREQALETVKAERNANGSTNINRNAVEVLVTPWLA